SLCDKNQIQVLLKNMENESLLLTKKETKGRRNRYYWLNPDILRYPFRPEPDKKHKPLIPDKSIEFIKNKLEGMPREPYFKSLSRYRKLNFNTFIGFLLWHAGLSDYETATKLEEYQKELWDHWVHSLIIDSMSDEEIEARIDAVKTAVGRIKFIKPKH
ncbi:MAG: hypothetical protein LUQ38_02320, partial [Methanotrichaceae archaeon]|nr:hypothetical protein [Methanotrichaceae archaeon]